MAEAVESIQPAPGASGQQPAPGASGQQPGTQGKKQLGKVGMIILIALLSCAAPIATDLYLPALPDMPAYFDTTEALINFTLVGFFLFNAVGMLLAGPLSDKYGRKPLVIISVAMFGGAAIIGGIAPNIWVLVLARVVQGVGGGGMVAICMAIVKDCYEGVTRQRVLVITQAISVVGPMVAPLLGAAILSFTDWRGTMFAQGVAAIIALLLILRMRETLKDEERIYDGVFVTVKRLGVVAKNKGFLVLLLVTSVSAAGLLAYISMVSYIYIDEFGLTKFQYSVYFAVNAALSAVGILFVAVLGPKINARKLYWVVMGVGLLSGVLIIVIGSLAPMAFFLSFAIFALAGGFIRPISTNILLDQHDGDTGSVSALINVVFSITGTLSMMTGSIPWSSFLFGLGVVIIITQVISLILFAWVLNSKKMTVRGL